MNVEKEAFAKGDGIKITMSGKLPLSGRIHSLAWQLPTFHAEPAGARPCSRCCRLLSWAIIPGVA